MPARRWLSLLCALMLTAAPYCTLTSSGQQPQSQSAQAPPVLPAPSPVPTPTCTMPATLLVPLPDTDGTADPVPADSNVGFIDPASPWNVVRMRFDAAYDSNRPTRGEYFITGSGPKDRGLPIPEKRIDYQEASLYAEYAILPQFSIFFDVPVRWLNPQLNANYSGVGDLQTGFKLAGIQTPDFTASVQIVGFIPTGKSQDGLGTGHVSVEPDVLLNWRAAEQILVEGMFGVWLPIDDTSYGSEILRYGVGVSYGKRPCDDFWIAPVVESTGWTTVRGHEQIVFSTKKSVKVSTVGDTIVNGDLGVRAGFGQTGDVFVGYSRALTGEVWYKDLWRMELRWHY